MQTKQAQADVAALCMIPFPAVSGGQVVCIKVHNDSCKFSVTTKIVQTFEMLFIHGYVSWALLYVMVINVCSRVLQVGKRWYLLVFARWRLKNNVADMDYIGPPKISARLEMLVKSNSQEVTELRIQILGARFFVLVPSYFFPDTTRSPKQHVV